MTEPVRAEIRRGRGPDGEELELRVDPVALAALAMARQAGGTPADFGALPEPEELPLRVMLIETRLEMVEGEIERLRGGRA